VKNSSLFISSLLALILLLGIVACGSTNKSSKSSVGQTAGQTDVRTASDSSRIAPEDSLIRREAPRPGTPNGSTNNANQVQKKRKKGGDKK